MVSKFILPLMGQMRPLPSVLIGAASALLVLQLPRGYCQNAPEPVAPATSGQTVADVKTYGAVGDGVTNDTAAFNAALRAAADAGGGVCLVPKGTYIISASGITAPYRPAVSSGVHLVGEGRGVSVLKVNGMPTNHFLQCDGDNWSVEGLTFDMQDYFPKHMVSAITCKGNNWRVANCAIIKIGRFGISAFGGDNWSIEGNYFTKTVPVGIENQSINVSVNRAGMTYARNARIIDNVCEGSGILFWGNHSLIARNRVSRTGFGSGICTGTSQHADALRITGNICTGGRGFDQNRTWVSGFELWTPNSVIANNTAYDNHGTGIIVGGQNSIVIGNHTYNNGVGAGGGFGFGARYLSPVNNASGSIFIGNVAHDTRYPGTSTTQTYGYAEQPGGLTDIKHFGNDYNHNRVGPIKSQAPRGSAVAAQISPEMKSKLKALAEDADLPETARRALRDCLAR